MRKTTINKTVLSALFLALGFVLPFFTGQIPQIGKMLLPMHIPALLCGFICGPTFGLSVGFIMPLCRSVIFNMPQLYPTAIAMAFELGAYGLISGIVYKTLHKKTLISTYIALVSAISGGRVAWGIAMCVILGVHKNGFTFSAFITSAFATALPGIALQLIVIPVVMIFLNRFRLIEAKE